MAFVVARVHAWPSVGVSSVALSTLGQQTFVVFSDGSVWGLGMNANGILGDGTTFFRSGLVPQRSEPHQGGLQTRCRHRTQNRSPPKTPSSHGEVLHAQTQRGRLEITTHLWEHLMTLLNPEAGFCMLWHGVPMLWQSRPPLRQGRKKAR